MSSINLEGALVLLTGVSNNSSIAAAIGREVVENHGRVILTYANEKLKDKFVQEYADEIGAEALLPLDVLNERNFNSLEEKLLQRYGENSFDSVIHSIAGGFKSKEQIDKGLYHATYDELNLITNISANSLLYVNRLMAPRLLKNKGNIISLSYEGGEKHIDGYEEMGVAKAALEKINQELPFETQRVLGKDINYFCLSPPPIPTWSAQGLGEKFENMVRGTISAAPNHIQVTQKDVARELLPYIAGFHNSQTGSTIIIDNGAHLAAHPYKKE